MIVLSKIFFVSRIYQDIDNFSICNIKFLKGVSFVVRDHLRWFVNSHTNVSLTYLSPRFLLFFWSFLVCLFPSLRFSWSLSVKDPVQTDSEDGYRITSFGPSIRVLVTYHSIYIPTSTHVWQLFDRDIVMKERWFKQEQKYFKTSF